MPRFIARQPILGADQQTIGYELLCRSGTRNFFIPDQNAKTNSRASLEVMGQTLCLIGLDGLTGGKTAFINFTPDLLSGGYVELLPKERFVVEIAAREVLPTPLFDECLRLKRMGYVFAIDDVAALAEFEPWRELAQIVKIDLRRVGAGALPGLVKTLRKDKVRLLAEKLETHAEYRAARELGFELYQGFYFSTPVMHETHQPDSLRATKLLLLEESTRPDFDLDRAEGIVKRDPTLSLKLLKYVNSSAMGMRGSVRDIRRALTILGSNNLRRWVLMLIMTQFTKGKPNALLALTVVRARFCELLSGHFGMADRGEDLFLLGLFSLLAAIFSAPTSTVIEHAHLSEPLGDALLGKPSAYGPVLQLVVGYENGAWEDVERIANESGVDQELLPGIYEESLEWAGRVSE